MNLSEAKIKTAWWSDSDFSYLVITSAKIGCRPSDLLLVMCSESELNPASVNTCPPNCPPNKPKPEQKYINAVGLNQLTREAAVACKFILPTDSFQQWCADVVKMSIAQQLDMAAVFFRNNAWAKAGKGYESALRIYLANAAPSLIFTELKDGDKPIYTGDVASMNSARSTIGQLQSGLTFWRTQDLYLAALTRLNDLFAF